MCAALTALTVRLVTQANRRHRGQPCDTPLIAGLPSGFASGLQPGEYLHGDLRQCSELFSLCRMLSVGHYSRGKGFIS